ncbi:MAG: hypothetical protein GXP55_22440 [Deltaproteobacteria bacterium]|nr:hypothetical protein [Deltaproteobacteria bacterium]
MRRFTFIIVLTLAGCSGAAETPPDAGTTDSPRVNGLTAEQAAATLVQIGDTRITVGEFAQRLAEQSPYLRARYNSPERRREFLENMVRFELLAQEAHRRGLDDDPEVRHTRDQVMIQQMMKTEFEDRIRLTDITDDEIRTYYEAHRDEFVKPEQVRASQIAMANRAAAQRVLAQIQAAPTDVGLFRRLAEANNEDAATRGRFGDLRFFSRPGQPGDALDRVPREVSEAAFALPRIGAVAPQLIRAGGSYHIVKLTGRRAALNRTVDEVRRPIQNRLWREKREQAIQDFLAGLRTQAGVSENTAALSQVRIDLPDAGSAGRGQVPAR